MNDVMHSTIVLHQSILCNIPISAPKNKKTVNEYLATMHYGFSSMLTFLGGTL